MIEATAGSLLLCAARLTPSDEPARKMFQATSEYVPHIVRFEQEVFQVYGISRMVDAAP
ncbi:hypothetical protein PQQ75_35125 [Paraburkholderia aspalathi]|uniref:hypothetical protein n=1 Tax=Paraburkholderia aspalathi TaxID=1324617 RepID=UPI0038B9A438